MRGSNAAAAGGTNLGLRLAVDDIRSEGPTKLAATLAQALRQAVRSGQLHAGAPVPPSRTMAADLEVSRGVVVRAYEQLVAEGYLTARTGQGTVVSDVHATQGTVPASADRAMPVSPGVPALRWFPRREWLRAQQSAMAEVADADLGYGDPRGHPRLREALASYLGRTRSVVAPVDQIVVTAGFAQAIRLVAEALVRHGVDAAGVEDPGSAGVVRSLCVGGLATRPLPVDDAGLQVGALAASDLRVAMVTPAHQFPTGAVLAPTRRAALLDWATTRQGIVIEDDYDAEYRYDRSPVGALQGLAPDRVIYGGSASKILAPGLRLGWVVAPAWLASTMADVKHDSDIAAPVLDQLALAVFIETGELDRHLRRTAARYATARRRLLEATATHLPGWRVAGAAAGLHAVLLPDQPIAPDLLDAAAAVAAPLGVVPLHAFSQGQARPGGLVIGYAAATADQIDRGVATLAAALR